jgi:hypothetical protein
MAIVTTSQNLTGVTYAQGEIIEIRNGATLTVSATPATRPGTIQCITSGKLRVENASPTVPVVLTLNDMGNALRFEAGGVLEFRGAPMSLAAGTGAAQTWDFATLFGGALRTMTYVEVEESAGSGVFMPWAVVHEDPKFVLNAGAGITIGGAGPTAFTAGDTVAGQALFWHETDRTLRCGDNVNGRAVPAGCAVRIPNIFVTNRLLTNQTRALNISTQGVPTGGTFTIEVARENGTVMGTTAAIPFNATSAQVDTAIEAITGAGTVTPGGGPLPTAVSVTWAGAYASERLGTRIVTNSLTGGTNPQPIISESSVNNMSAIDLAPLGTMDAEWVSISDKFRMVTDTFKSIRLVGVGTGGDAWQANSSNGGVELDGFSTCRSPFSAQSTSQIASVFGPVSVKRVVSSSKNPIGFNVNVAPALTAFDRVTVGFYGLKSNSTSTRTLQVLTIPAGLKLTNIVGLGASIGFTNLTGCTIAGIQYADATTNVQQTIVGLHAILTTNCTGCTFANYASAGPAQPRGYVIAPDAASSSLKLLGGAADGANNMGAALSMACGGLEIANVSLANVRTGPLIDLPSNYLANNLIAKKLFATFATAQSVTGLDACQGGHYDMVTSGIAGITETFSGVNDWVGGNYTDPSLTPTTGHVTFGPFGAGTGLELTGAAYTDASGAFLLPEAGDTAVVTMPFAMHGITGFQSVAPYLYVDAPGAAANVGIAIAPGVPTGGTFTITVANAAGTVLGTTTALAYNASATTVQTAVRAIMGAAEASASGSSIGGGYTITGTGTFAGVGFILSVDGSALTGGTEPGVAYAIGRARLLTGTETLGALMTAEFAMRVPGTAWPAYAALTGANLAAAFAALTGYAAGGSGLEMRLKVTAGQTNPYTKLNQISLPTTVDASLWTVGDATITLQGPAATDVTRVVRASDNVVLYSFTGGGTFPFTVGANFDVPVYFRRENASGTVLMRTLPATQPVNFGDNGIVSLFYGAEVQLAQASTLAALDALIQARLDVAVSTREAESAAAARAVTAQAEHDATQSAIAAIPAAPNSAAIQAAAAAAIAAAEPLAADVRYVRGIEVVGTGVEADPWGPA